MKYEKREMLQYDHCFNISDQSTSESSTKYEESEVGAGIRQCSGDHLSMSSVIRECYTAQERKQQIICRDTSAHTGASAPESPLIWCQSTIFDWLD